MRQAVALGFVLAGVLLLLRAAGVWFGDAVVGPVLLAGVGSAVLWVRSDAPRRRSWARLAVGEGAVDHAADTEVSPLRIVVGTVLVAAALGGFVAANEALGAVRELATALVAAAAGIGLLFGPWLWRLVEELGHERRERIRQEERAELAAHLHDSVLQTLVLIQRSGDDPRRVAALARRQERELRNWLYHGPPATDDAPTLASAVRRTAEEVETDHGVEVEVVVVGDADLDTAGRALLAAVREACVNAARHAQVTSVDVYVEVEDTRITAFVRDRGRGFRLANVPADRQGIRSSIVGRLERHGGHAEVHTSPGQGTEVEVTLPRPTRRDNGDGQDRAGHGDPARGAQHDTVGRDTIGRDTIGRDPR